MQANDDYGYGPLPLRPTPKWLRALRGQRYISLSQRDFTELRSFLLDRGVVGVQYLESEPFQGHMVTPRYDGENVAEVVGQSEEMMASIRPEDGYTDVSPAKRKVDGT